MFAGSCNVPGYASVRSTKSGGVGLGIHFKQGIPVRRFEEDIELEISLDNLGAEAVVTTLTLAEFPLRVVNLYLNPNLPRRMLVVSGKLSLPRQQPRLFSFVAT